MLAVVSPAKKLDFEMDAPEMVVSEPEFLDDLMNLMGISENLADLNYQRFQHFSRPFDRTNAKPAIYAFRGDTYIGLDADTMDAKDIDWAEGHFRMLSGLYGLLKPRDLMQPYRLEMGTRLENPRGKDLYAFWGDKLSQQINAITKGHKDRSLINLASNEYFKSVKKDALEVPVITPVFKEVKVGVAKVISFSAKRARGMMARYMIDNRLESPEDLKSFDLDGYRYQNDLSNDNEWVFTREHD